MAETIAKQRSAMHWRGLTSLIITLAILVLATTGLMLYVAPQGRVANWTGWTLLGLGKEQWSAVHITASLLFVIASAFHVYFNWTTLLHYFVLKHQLHLKREMAVAVVLVSGAFVATLLDIPPFSSVIALNERIKVYWEGQHTQAPYPHAESSTLEDFAERTGVSLSALQQRLALAGITVNDPASETLGDLAHANGLSPNELFSKVFKTSGSGRVGAALGMQTVQHFCDANDLPLEKTLESLRQQGFMVTPETTFKAMAEQKGVTPAEVRDSLVETTE